MVLAPCHGIMGSAFFGTVPRANHQAGLSSSIAVAQCNLEAARRTEDATVLGPLQQFFCDSLREISSTAAQQRSALLTLVSSGW